MLRTRYFLVLAALMMLSVVLCARYSDAFLGRAVAKDSLQDVVTAIIQNDIAALNEYIAAKNNLNAIVPDTKKKYTLLLFAIEMQNDSAVKALLDAGADPLLETIFKSPLNLALLQRNIYALDLLLSDNRVLVGINSPSGVLKETPLYIAVMNNDEEMVKRLVKLGARSDVKTTLGKTLDELCSENDLPGCRYLE